MNFGEFQEKKSRGTFDFPIELHHVTKEHPRYQMPFHWHMDYELIRVLKGSLVLSLNEETLNLTENSGIVLVCDGVLHGGMPVDCVYECLDFDLNEFLRGCSAGKKDIDDVQSHRIILDDFFAVDSEEYKTANRLFDTFIEEKKGYEFIIQGLLFELMGQILGNHRYKISDDETYKSLKSIATIVVILLSSSSVAIAGPISFIGLITPHIVIKLGARNFRESFILCGIYGANLLLLSDIISKILKYPYESPVGIVTAFMGAVFYIILANKEMKRGGVSEK